MNEQEIATILCMFFAAISVAEAVYTNGQRGGGWAFCAFICLLAVL